MIKDNILYSFIFIKKIEGNSTIKIILIFIIFKIYEPCIFLFDIINYYKVNLEIIL